MTMHTTITDMLLPLPGSQANSSMSFALVAVLSSGPLSLQDHKTMRVRLLSTLVTLTPLLQEAAFSQEYNIAHEDSFLP